MRRLICRLRQSVASCAASAAWRACGLAPFLLGVAVFGEPGFQGHDLADGAGDAGELQRRVGLRRGGGVRWRPGRHLGRRAHRLAVQGTGEVHAERAEFGEHQQVALGALLRRVGGSRDRLGDGWGEIHEQNMNKRPGKVKEKRGSAGRAIA